MTLPRGFLGTRADVLMDVAIIVFTALPFILGMGIRLARSRRFAAHRGLQTNAAILILVLLTLFEVDIRISGGSRAFIAQSALSAGFIRGFLLCHVAVALATFACWATLLLRSRKHFGKSLPGSFSNTHRAWGWTTFVGVCLLSSSGAALYVMLFVA